MIDRDIPDSAKRKVYETKPRTIYFKNGSVLKFRSGEYPRKLRGEKLAGVVFDESANIKREVWESSIRPALGDSEGWAIFIGTPLGKKNWFYELFQHGLSDDPEWYDYK